MTDNEPVASCLSPPAPTLAARIGGRWWTQWQAWLCLSSLGVALVALGLIPYAMRRTQHLKNLDQCGIKYEFAEDDQWMTDYFGPWSRPFRSVQSIQADESVTDFWRHITAFKEVETLEVPGRMLTATTVRNLHELPNLKMIVTDWIRDDRVKGTLQREWTVEEHVYVYDWCELWNPHPPRSHPPVAP